VKIIFSMSTLGSSAARMDYATARLAENSLDFDLTKESPVPLFVREVAER
jgi:hypothetical protein